MPFIDENHERCKEIGDCCDEMVELLSEVRFKTDPRSFASALSMLLVDHIAQMMRCSRIDAMRKLRNDYEVLLEEFEANPDIDDDFDRAKRSVH